MRLYRGHSKSLFRAENGGWKHPGSAGVGVLVPLCSPAQACTINGTQNKLPCITWAHVSSEVHVHKRSQTDLLFAYAAHGLSFMHKGVLKQSASSKGLLVLHGPLACKVPILGELVLQN